ncbi:MAG TPA: hypothetical protein VFA63_10380 [Pseudonocardiaceae bacterium]|nr:hypothetical protein [Pseudonocardiaceae bacterium]
MTTTSRHRRRSPVGWLPVIGAALVGAAVGAGALAVASPRSPTHQPNGPSEAAAAATASAVSSNGALPSPAEARASNPIAFSPPITDAAGMSLTVLRPEKIKGGVRLTIAVVNINDIPISVDTGAVGPRDARFNNVAVPVTTTPGRKRLAPGEGYTYQAVVKLPTTNTGQLSFVVGMARVTGPAAGD